MLSCREVTETASDVVDGGLGLRRRAGVLLHLVICRPCRTYLDQMRATVGLSGGRPVPALPAVEAAVLAAVGRRSEEPDR